MNWCVSACDSWETGIAVVCIKWNVKPCLLAVYVTAENDRHCHVLNLEHDLLPAAFTKELLPELLSFFIDLW